MGVSVICAWNNYFSSDCDEVFLMNTLGKPLSEISIVSLCIH